MMRRRPTQVFSLAFLDCICCGFGAIILIFVLSVSTQDRANQETLAKLRAVIAAHLASIAQIHVKKDDLEKSNARVTDLIVDARLKNDSIHALLDELEGQLQNEKKGQKALVVDADELKKDIAARQKKTDVPVLPDVKPLPVGLPVSHTNYVVFVVDCSGSMRDPTTDQLWSIVVRKMQEVLEIYPKIEGFQFIDADGRFILRGGARWIEDSPEARTEAIRTVRRYSADNNSNPVPGILQALTRLYDPTNDQMKMGIYIFGDEFSTDESAEAVIRRLDELNPADASGNRKVTINAIGFPTTINYEFSMGNTGLRFANLMREVCYEHGGAFIALQDL
jgi:hypothetical protein